MRYPILWLVPALLCIASACADDRDPTAASGSGDDVIVSEPAPVDGEQGRLERLARRTALALRDPSFRTLVRSELGASPFREHKLQFQRFLGRPDGAPMRALSAASGDVEASIGADAAAARPLEFYFPVHGQREAWQGDENILVATAINDHDTPVAYDTQGRRHLLSADHPPAVPVLAVEPQETDLDHPAPALQRTTCNVDDCGPSPSGGYGSKSNAGSGSGGGDPVFHGLFMSHVEFSGTFEGWLKGDPEFELHILAPNAPGDNSTYHTLWCIGEHGDTYWDLNSTSWNGNLMLYGQSQLDAFHAKYPGQNFSLLALEDDDTSCQVKVDNDNMAAFVGAVNTFTNAYKGAKDNIGLNGGTITAVKALWSLIAEAINWIKSNDDLIGVAIANTVTGYSNPSANWSFIGYNQQRYGWIQLDLK
ncbi:MAG: hypothetical protein ACREL2_11605 [Gemmatimonadales bacterium]